jgi:prepilin peptidase CpaA
MLDFFVLFAVPFLIILSAITDFATFRIPNWISLALVFTFLVAARLENFNVATIVGHSGAGLGMLLVGLALFSSGWLGGGDAKLMAAAALWLGFEHLLPFLLWTAILGGGLALLLIVYRRMLPPRWLIRQTWALRLHDPKEGIPYGIALAGAALIVYPQTIWMTGIAG